MTRRYTVASRLRVPCAAAILACTATAAAAQTPSTAVGLGLPVAPIDARAAGLGGGGLALSGGSLSARNPAEILFYANPVLGITYAPENATVRGPMASPGGGRSRVSILRGAVPLNDLWAVGVSFAGELDQDWQVSFADTLITSSGTYPFSEQRDQDGGISSVNFSLARRIGRVALGAEFGIITGSVQQRFLREFQPAIDDPGNVLANVAGDATWNYSGSRIRVGAAADATRRLRLSIDASLQPTLTADRDSIDGVALRRKYDMPNAVEVGAGLRATPSVLLTASAGWTGWSGATGGSTTYEAADVLWAGIGAEILGAELLGADLPLRLGLRVSDLPFYAAGGAQASERAVTAGFGLRVGGDRARLDAAFEFGRRGDLAESGFEETFRRLYVTMLLFQD